MRMMSWMVRGAVVGTLLVSATPMLSQESAQTQAELATALHGKHVPLTTGIAAVTAKGKPISAKYEYEGGKLLLSVYTEKGGQFSEVLVNPRTGRVEKTEKITEGDDLKASQAQSAASAKAKSSLASAVAKALATNKGYTAVSAIATTKNGQPTADITLMKGTEFKTVSEPL
jgi:hypothetical protein